MEDPRWRPKGGRFIKDQRNEQPNRWPWRRARAPELPAGVCPFGEARPTWAAGSGEYLIPGMLHGYLLVHWIYSETDPMPVRVAHRIDR